MNDQANYVQKICEKFWRGEEEYKLFERKVIGGLAWPMIRFHLYYLVTQQFNVFSNPHPHNRSVGWAVKLGFRATASFFRNLTLLAKLFRTSTIIVEHPRTRDVGGVKMDVYSYDYIKEQAPDAVIMSRSFNGCHGKTDGFTRLSIDLVEVVRSVSGGMLSRLPIPLGEIGIFIDQIYPELATETEYPGEAERLKKAGRRLARRCAVEYIVSRWIFRCLFRIAFNCKRLVIIDGYSSRAGVIAAAKDAGLHVVELQHGVIGKYHLGYSYKSQFSRRHMADKLLVWSRFWHDELEGAWPAEIGIYGYKYLLNVKARLYPDVRRRLSTVVVISQGAISEKLSEYIYRNRDKLNEFQVYYKLHPSEVDSWRSKPSLVELSRSDNFEVVERGDIYRLLLECEYQIGVFSTAIHEGHELGCKTILIPLPGVEYMRNFKSFVWFEDFFGGRKGCAAKLEQVKA